MKSKQNFKLYLIFGSFVMVFVILTALHAADYAYIHPNSNIFISILMGALNVAEAPFAFTFRNESLIYIGASLFLFTLGALYFWVQKERNQHAQHGTENGTSHWNDDLPGYNKEFTSPKGSPSNNGPNNMILSQNVFLNMNTRETLRNNNVLICGGSGSGKSRFLIKPNILQANANYVVTDPAGELLESTGGFLEREGYDVKVFNLVEMSKSDQYNPFHYIRDDPGVLMMINCLIQNTNAGKSGGDPFWEKSEMALLQALCFYLIHYCPKHLQNFTTVMKLLRAAEVDENNANKKSKLDRLFDQVAESDPNSIALKQYLTFKMGAGKTLKSILISCSVRLTVFNMKEIENLTCQDTIELDKMAGTYESETLENEKVNNKKALFVIIPAADSTYNFLVSMMYSQLFETLYFIGETKSSDKKLPRPIRFLLDEFANIGQIPEFTKKLATMRKYDISCTIVYQDLSQLKAMYEKDWGSVISNCDTFLFLGGKDGETAKYISEQLGDTTITVRNRSMSKGGKGGANHSFNQQGRKLLLPSEVADIDNKKCIVMIRGVSPFLDDKYEYTKHPNYKYTGDANKDYLYINKRNNGIQISTEEEKEIKKEEKINKMYSQSEKSANPSDKIITQPLPKTVCNKIFGYNKETHTCDNLLIPEDDINDMVDSLITPLSDVINNQKKNKKEDSDDATKDKFEEEIKISESKEQQIQNEDDLLFDDEEEFDYSGF